MSSRHLPRKKKPSPKKTLIDGKPGSALSLLDPKFQEPRFRDFESLAKTYDALIAEFYEYYRQRGGEEPNLFGFVSVRHVVEFSSTTNAVFTENCIGQKTTIIYAPLISGETLEDQNQRRLQLLVAFDHTKRASHILAMSLLFGLLTEKGVQKLIHKHGGRRPSEPQV
jgi:hypothetical protein